jgi:hypothetical protein
MPVACTWQTCCAFFLAAFGASMGWGFGLFLMAQITRALVRLFGLA